MASRIFLGIFCAFCACLGFVLGKRHERVRLILVCQNLRLQTPLSEEQIAAFALREIGAIDDG